MDAQTEELKENMEWFSQDLKAQLRAECEKGAHFLEKSKKDIEQKWEEQEGFAKEFQEKLNLRLKEQVQKFYESLEKDAESLHREILAELEEKYSNIQKDLQEGLNEQQSLQANINLKRSIAIYRKIYKKMQNLYTQGYLS